MNQGVSEIKQLDNKVYLLGYHYIDGINGIDVYEHIVELNLNINSENYIVVEYSKTYGMLLEKNETGNSDQVIPNGMLMVKTDGIEIYLISSHEIRNILTAYN